MRALGRRSGARPGPAADKCRGAQMGLPLGRVLRTSGMPAPHIHCESIFREGGGGTSEDGRWGKQELGARSSNRVRRRVLVRNQATGKIKLANERAKIIMVK